MRNIHFILIKQLKDKHLDLLCDYLFSNNCFFTDENMKTFYISLLSVTLVLFLTAGISSQSNNPMSYFLNHLIYRIK